MSQSDRAAPQSLSCGILEVVGDVDPGQVSITNCSIRPSRVDSGQSVEIEVTVQNGTEVSASVDIQTQASGQSLGTASDSIPANSSKILTVTVPGNITDNLGVGSYSVSAEITNVSTASPAALPAKHRDVGVAEIGTLALGLGTVAFTFHALRNMGI